MTQVSHIRGCPTVLPCKQSCSYVILMPAAPLELDIKRKRQAGANQRWTERKRQTKESHVARTVFRACRHSLLHFTPVPHLTYIFTCAAPPVDWASMTSGWNRTRAPSNDRKRGRWIKQKEFTVSGWNKKKNNNKRKKRNKNTFIF